jgi:PAS domain S-box-containing protein
MRVTRARNLASEFEGSSSAATRIMGKGDMARRLRDFDWAPTPLGPIEGWSRELVAIVNLVLASPTPARLLWGPSLVIIHNDSYLEIPGRLHPDALGKPAREVFKDAWNIVGPVLETAFVTGEPFVYDRCRVQVETGEGMKEFYLNCTYSPVYENGASAGLLGLFHDVTGEVSASYKLEARLNAISETSLDPIALVAPDGVLVDCNRAWLRFTATSRPDAIGRHLTAPPCFAATPGVPMLLRRAITTAAGGEKYRSELSLTPPDGDSLALDFSLKPQRDSHGAVTFLVAEGRDISDEKRIQSALLKSEKLASVGRLASSIAHEINNPLESVMNLIYLARNAAPDEARKYLDLADQEIRRVSIIANQTLRFHKQASKPQASTAADLFSTVMSIHEGRLRNAHIQVEKRFRTDDPVICYPGDIRQVLNNLVANALEAMPLGGRLLIRSRAGRDWRTGRRGLVLTIADNGSGIPSEARGRIFEAFFTTKGAAGNGLGLWVCQEIVERHRGELRVRSTQRPGRHGTAFMLFLPFDSSRQQAA